MKLKPMQKSQKRMSLCSGRPVGETTDSQKNQFGLAVVTVSAEGAVIDQRVISFVGGAVERIADAVNPNEKKKGIYYGNRTEIFNEGTSF